MNGRLVLVNAVMGVEYAQPLPPLVRMTGPLIDMRPHTAEQRSSQLSAAELGWLAAERQAVYVAFGTIAPLTDTTLRVLYDALVELSADYTVVWKVSPSLAALLPQPPPPSLHMTGWVSSQPALLCHPHMALFISHCGTHSAHESLYCGVPVLCLPVQGDQYDNAQRLSDAHAGSLLHPATTTAAQLVQRARAMLSSTDDGGDYRRHAQRLSALVRLAGGVEVAAGWVEWVAQYGVEGLVESGDGWRVWVRQGWDVMAVWCGIAVVLSKLVERMLARVLRRCWLLKAHRIVLTRRHEVLACNGAVDGRVAVEKDNTDGLRRRRINRPAG